MDDTVSVRRRQRKHRLVRLFHTPPVLPYLLFARRNDSSRRIFHKDARIYTFMVAYAGIVPSDQAAGVFRNRGIGIHIDEVQSRFAAPATRSGTLGAGYSAWIVDALSLRSGDEFFKIFRIAASERKYPSGTRSSKMPDNVQPAPLLGDSEICAVMHAPFNTIPQLNKRGEDGFKCPAAVMRQQTDDIFQKKKCRPFRFSNSGNLKEQSSSCIILKSEPLSRDREALVIPISE